jgi:nicotinamidase-related amidase
MGRLLIRGEYGHDMVDELQPVPGEPVIDKPGYGAFYQTDLDIILRNAGIRTLVFTGVTTNVCVQSTLREAVDRGYECITLDDCCATSDMPLHDATMAMIRDEGDIFGRVMSSNELLESWALQA